MQATIRKNKTKILFAVITISVLTITLFLTIPYKITIFSDSFQPPETNAFENWNPGANIETPSSSIIIVNLNGVYCANACAYGTDDSVMLQDNFSASLSAASAECSVMFTQWGNAVGAYNDPFIRFLKLPGDTLQNSVACAAIVFVNGTEYWGLHWRDGNQVLHYTYVTSPLPQLGVWYHVRIDGCVSAKGTGYADLYVNGVELISETGLTNNLIGNMYAVQIGCACEGKNATYEAYFTNVAVTESTHLSLHPHIHLHL